MNLAQTPKTLPLLSVTDLRIHFSAVDKEAVQGISFAVSPGEIVALIGESGSGKSVTALAVTRLLPPRETRVSGSIDFQGKNLLQLPAKELRAIRGRKIAYIFQEPGASLNPSLTIGHQMAEILEGLPRQERLEKIRQHLRDVGILDTERCRRSYPHELSGGMQQRVMIAMAILQQPDLLIADEPTTALDVTLQKQILDLLKGLQAQRHFAILIITHNLLLVSHFADRILVMFRGHIVEAGETKALLQEQKHPYTRALFQCIPRFRHKHQELNPIDYTKLGIG
ncbi:MAG: ABC transporter ATP-binding protein [Puniceicoccales bacterium]|jgi:ABC-type dipeptide/oligopeptide/nickel transport system ATPase component|nr:ABC transporter ATP-binding protein [Puniceicoccales bacterium]